MTKRAKNILKKKAQNPVQIPSIEELEVERKRLRHQSAFRKSVLRTVYVLLVVAAAAVLIATLVLPVMQISGDSMTPTLEDGDIVVLLKTDQFECGDLCSFSWNDRTLMKRIIGVPGDWIEIDAYGNVYVNGEMLEEPYITDKRLRECDISFPFQTPDGYYFVLGDHRVSAVDSRSIFNWMCKERSTYRKSYIPNLAIEQTWGYLLIVRK